MLNVIVHCAFGARGVRAPTSLGRAAVLPMNPHLTLTRLSQLGVVFKG